MGPVRGDRTVRDIFYSRVSFCPDERHCKAVGHVYCVYWQVVMKRTVCFTILSLVISGVFAIAASGQGGCDCVPDQVIVQLNSAADLPAVATQYHLDATPISQMAQPPIYLLHINNGQTPPQVVAAMAGDTRIIFREVNRILSQVERPGLPWTQGRSWAIGRSW